MSGAAATREQIHNARQVKQMMQKIQKFGGMKQNLDRCSELAMIRYSDDFSLLATRVLFKSIITYCESKIRERTVCVVHDIDELVRLAEVDAKVTPILDMKNELDLEAILDSTDDLDNVLLAHPTGTHHLGFLGLERGQQNRM